MSEILFTNTTQITEAGYETLLRMRNRKKRIAWNICGLILALPFFIRLCYAAVVTIFGDGVSFAWYDVVFTLLLVGAACCWCVMPWRIQKEMEDARGNVDMDAVNHYTFFTDHVQMITTSSSEKFQLDYDDITRVDADNKWIAIYFGNQKFTMLVDCMGFTQGTAENCIAFLHQKQSHA